ncbi:MAG TPA: hypothetical protein PK965_08290 [Anaerohalosphaeraceae bacterium]|nr:hypothetical protein [Anaerohalosphaeraceae bacterium]
MVMDIVKGYLKKYSALLLPAGLLLAGLILFLPTILIGRTVSEKKQEWEKIAQTLDSLTRTTPPKEQAEQIQRILQQYKTDAEAVQKMSLQSSMRDLIKYGIFPKSADTSSQVYLDFGRRYRAAIEQMVTERLKALDAPSDAEIRAAGAGPGAGAVRGGEYIGGGAGGIGFGGSTAENPMVNAVCNARAERIVMYANPRVFSWYDFWESYQFVGAEQALRDCWFSQTAYWIYEDVVAAIEAMNTGSQRVADSPVKRLMGVSFQRPVSDVSMVSPYPTGNLPRGIGGIGGLAASAMADPPAYVLAGSTSPLVSRPWTGRTCNDEMDVVHFAVSVVVDSRYTQAFLKELCSAKPHVYREGFKENGELRQARHNQITILASTFSAVDKQSLPHLYYRYGTDAVMRVDLVCEYLFLRKAYDEIKPEPVKVLLGQSQQGASSVPMGPGGY